MKQCPVCQKQYPDDIAFCSADGTALKLVSPDAAMTVAGVGPALVPVSMTSALEGLVGQVIDGKVQVESVLGRGGMGAVYRARHLLLDRVVAVKVLRADLLGTQNLGDRFLREARTAARIEHPNIITVYDFGILGDGNAYLVMEYVQGQSLRDLLKTQGALPLSTTFQLIQQICAGVDAAHTKNIIHRDLKPENIMLKDNEQGDVLVKILDFGLAKLIESSDSIANLTGTGEILGTPAYMSPEHCDGGELDHRADIYSLGVIFYEMLTGQPPFRGRVVSVLSAHLTKKPEPPVQVNPHIPVDISDAIMHALEKEKDARPASVRKFFEQIEQAFARTRTHATRAIESDDTPVAARPASSSLAPPESFLTVQGNGAAALTVTGPSFSSSSQPPSEHLETLPPASPVVAEDHPDAAAYVTIQSTEQVPIKDIPPAQERKAKAAVATQVLTTPSTKAIDETTPLSSSTSLLSTETAGPTTTAQPNRWRPAIIGAVLVIGVGGAALGTMSLLSPGSSTNGSPSVKPPVTTQPVEPATPTTTIPPLPEAGTSPTEPGSGASSSGSSGSTKPAPPVNSNPDTTPETTEVKSEPTTTPPPKPPATSSKPEPVVQKEEKKGFWGKVGGGIKKGLEKIAGKDDDKKKKDDKNKKNK
ncbi:MAG TPA: serine/threonine-protein kinase [Acidobacteriota bacterium]|nr:serine/threonine-protein kinase [Acidobacteriota bacterium]HMZ78311.1 serine/threonine-protein kinase [Acidobacteriota bacterium]HND19583.1 serine/threonine-protein kinase [Acidobacteriota bacterium]HNG91656.1 serine/threonine-protein kinase [Acidobacteriota bacterium]